MSAFVRNASLGVAGTQPAGPGVYERSAVALAERRARAAEFRTRGYVVLRGLLGKAEVEAYTRHLERLSRHSRTWVNSVSAALRGEGGRRPAWVQPDGVSQNPEFWDLVVHPALLDAARAVLAPDVRYLPHSDLHVGFSATRWHRDNVDRTLGEGSDWDEQREPYRLARVALYLQSFGESRFSLGVIPGTHRADSARPLRRAIEQEAARLSHGEEEPSGLSGHADWVRAEAGDAVIFDPRILHSGSPINGPKYSVFLAYGVPGLHYYRHGVYYRHVRGETRYRDMPTGLVARLREHGLYAPIVPPPGAFRADWRGSSIAGWKGRALR